MFPLLKTNQKLKSFATFKYERLIGKNRISLPFALRRRKVTLECSCFYATSYQILQILAVTMENRPAVRLATQITYLPRVGPLRAPLLERLGIHRGRDLLFFFPRDYESAAPLQKLQDFAENLRISFVGVVREVDERVSQSGKHLFGAVIAGEGGGFVRLIWFNQPFRKNEIRPGMRLLATGVLRSTVLNWEMVQPQVLPLAADEIPPTQKPLPVYPLTEGLKQPMIREIMRENIPVLISEVEEVLPNWLRDKLELPALQSAIHDVHLPDDISGAESARRRFKLQELLVLQLAIALQRKSREQSSQSPPCQPTGKIHARILNRLPHALTADQIRAVDDIGRDMSSERPMNRLLQGDVGSGKTLVAQYAMLLCVAHGYQAALMAPTEVLARQHAASFEKCLASSRVRVALITGSMTKAARTELLAQLASGEIDLLVGTQAMLSADVRFKNLGLVIVDEQHKFGVMQRAQLRGEQFQPHYLVLSATPIPRTIAMTIFGDLDISTIRTKPPGRAPVHTYLGTLEKLDSWWNFVDQQIAGGRQAYVIAPRVNDSESSEIASATTVFNELSRTTFQHRTIGLLHGRLSSAEKERVLNEFVSGHFQILVATTVVEVGIDVPNATVMTILDAERLGLSQLHQLRGRVSRGTQAGFVCAITSRNCKTEENDRLTAFESSDDGFELAEMDLKLRGPGDLLGTQQHGLPPLRIADLVTDGDLVVLAKQTAAELLAKSPELGDPDLAGLRRQTLNRYGKSMQLSDIG